MPHRHATEAEVAWSAGLFEGEGSVSIPKNGAMSLKCEIGMTDEEPIREFARLWGGRGVVRVDRSSRPGYRSMWRVVLGPGDAKVFLPAIRPYVRRKRLLDKIDLAVEYMAQKRGKGETNPPWSYVELQYGYYLRMKELNRRGPRSTDPLLVK